MNTLPHSAPPGFQWITRAVRRATHTSGMMIDAETSNGGIVHNLFASRGGGIWEWTIVPAGEEMPPATGMMIPAYGTDRESVTGGSAPEPLAAGSSIMVSDGMTTLRIDADPWHLRFDDGEENALFRENPADVDGLGRPFVLPFGLVHGPDGVERITLSFHLDPDEHLYGLGEKFMPINRRGQTITAWTQDAFGSTSERSHKNIPLLISTRGYGLFLDTGARITWDLGATSCQSCTVSVEASALRLFLLTGGSPDVILQRYTRLTGTAPVPPAWTFGLWVSSGGTYRDRKAMEQLVAGLEEHRIPADVVHVDPWWMTWRRYCDFVWDREAFPDPEGFIGGLHSRGLRLCLWEHPYVSVESPLFDAAKERGYLLRKPGGEVYVIDYGLSLAPRPDGIVREASPENSWNAPVAIIDMSNPDAVAWFQDLHRPVLRMGADVFKTDFGEDVPPDAVFHNGQTGRTMHNLYPLLYNEAVAAVTREEKGHSAVWGRAAIGGSQRTPVCWSGDPAADFDSLACTIRGGLSLGFSGVPFWSNDIGGYRGTPDPVLYIRWAQFGLFCSHSRMHGDSPREPWAFGEEALRIVRQYVELRYRLFPYLYSAAVEAHESGMPVMRALALMWPDDPNALDRDQQYMLGPWLMVAPVVRRSGKKSLYLPEGDWIEYWTGERHRGPRTIHLQVPLEILPLYVRAGAILPSMRTAQRIPEAPVDPLIVDLYPSRSSSFEVHEPGGKTRITLTQSNGRGVVKWESTVKRSILFHVHAPGSGTDAGPAGAWKEYETGPLDRGTLTVEL